MNSRPTSTDESPTTRLPARARFTPSPPSHAFDYGSNDKARTAAASSSSSRSKSGINGRDNLDDEDELTGRMGDREMNKRTAAAANAAKQSLDELERDFSLARSNSNLSSASGGGGGRDRPWRTASSSGGSNAVSPSSISSVSSPQYNPSPRNYTSDRWAQYETDDLAEQSRRATSNAVVDMATKFADKAADEYDDGFRGDEMMAPMGGSVGTGYGNNNGDDDNNRSTTDYVKGRLSSLLSPDHRNSTRNNNPSMQRLTHSAPAKYQQEEEMELEYDKVRSQAMKMLMIADSLDSPGRNNSKGSINNSPDNEHKTTGLFRTKTGGLAMRQLHDDEVANIKKGKNVSSIAGLDRFSNERNTPKMSLVGSGDEEDAHSQHFANDEYGEEDNGTGATSRSSSWSSRYSVERQLMAITGGLDSAHMLDKMDNLHASREKTKSARGLYRSSTAAMDGSGEQYTDYTTSYSLGLGLSGMWEYIRGTLWSDLELNYDGTTQSLVRREKRRVKRRRIMIGFVSLVALSVAVGVLVVKGNTPTPNSGPVNFYVLADEPYDLSNARQLTLELEKLPSDAEFVVHLGNANGDAQSACQEYGYERAANILRESPVPVFVIPGDRDWVTCNRPQQSLDYWSINLSKFDQNFTPRKFKVDYQEGNEENFAFLHKGVLFLSVHIVDAETDASEWTSRHERNVMWTKEKLSQFDDGDYHSLVIFGHAAPSSKQGEYFWPVVDQLKDMDKPVLYLHANSDGNFEEYKPFGEADNFSAVQLEKRGREAPMKVTVLDENRKSVDPFVFTRRDITKDTYEANGKRRL